MRTQTTSQTTGTLLSEQASPTSTAFAKSSHVHKMKQQENTYFWVCTLFF